MTPPSVLVVAAAIVDGTAEPLVEHDELRWLHGHQWLDVPWLDADVRIVEALTARYAT